MSIDPFKAGTNKLEMLFAKTQGSVSVVDIFGGRKFSYAGVSASLSDYVKELNAIVQDLFAYRFWSRKKECLILSIIHEIKVLNGAGNSLLQNEAKTSRVQRLLTSFWQSGESYRRILNLDRIQYKCFWMRAQMENVPTYQNICFPIDQGRGRFFEFAKVYVILNPSFLSKNLHLFGLDRTSFLDVLEDIQSLPISHGNMRLYINLEALRSAFNEFPLNLSNQKERGLLLRFIRVFVRIVAPESLYCSEDRFRALMRVLMDGFQHLGFNPLEKEGLVMWKKLFKSIGESRFGPNFMKDFITMGILNPLNKKELPTYVKLLKLYNPAGWCCYRMNEITGIGIKSFKELQTLTSIIRGLSKQYSMKNVRGFIYKNEIYGKTAVERKYLKKITGKINIPFKRLDGSCRLASLPLELLQEIFSKVDVPTLLNLLSTCKDPLIIKSTWIGLLGQHRPSSNESWEDLRDFTDALSFCTGMEKILTYGQYIRTLDLPHKFYSPSYKGEIPRPCESHSPERWVPVFEKIAKACPHLTTLRINSQTIDEKVCLALPQTLQTLELSNCTIQSLEALPVGIHTLILHDIKIARWQDFINIPDSIKTMEIKTLYEDSYNEERYFETLGLPSGLRILRCNRTFSVDSIPSLPESLEEFFFYKWKDDFVELILYLPINLKKLSIQHSKIYGVTDGELDSLSARLKNLELLDVYISCKTKKNKWPEYCKKLVCYEEQLSCLPSNLEALGLFPDQGYIDVNFQLLPKNIRSLYLHGKHIKEGVPRLPDNITNVYLDWSRSSQELLAFLPVNLERLSLRAIQEDLLNDFDLNSLPATVTSLNFKNKVSGKFLKTHELPERIKRIGFYYKQSGRIASFLHKKIEYYSGPLKTIADLPKSVKILNLHESVLNRLKHSIQYINKNLGIRVERFF